MPDIKVFKKDKPEVYKVLKYILKSDIKVMKDQADTIDIRLEVFRDKAKMRNKDLFVNKVKLGNNIENYYESKF